MRLAAGTIVSKRNLALARVIATSFQRHHASIPFYVLLTDRVDGCFDPHSEPFRLVTLEELRLPGEDRLRFGYAERELSFAVTPHWVEYLLSLGYEGAVFIKQESMVTGDLSPVLDGLREHPVLLTPHFLEPPGGPEATARELEVLRAGAYNGGFLAFAAVPAAREFLAWWRDRMNDQCTHSAAEGMHFEQRWLDFVTAFVEGVSIVEDAGVNVGHWNLPERRVVCQGEEIRVNGGPVRLFRFSGYDPEQPDQVTRYLSRYRMEDLGDAAEVFRRYRSALDSAGYHQCKRWPYSFGRFDNGEPIPELARRIYRDLGDEAQRFGDPFETGARTSFYQWLKETPDQGGSLSRFWRAVYEKRPDLWRAFPDPQGKNRRSFLGWTYSHGAAEMGAGPGLIRRPAYNLLYLAHRAAVRVWKWRR
jgi:hypothetical protein